MDSDDSKTVEDLTNLYEALLKLPTWGQSTLASIVTKIDRALGEWKIVVDGIDAQIQGKQLPAQFIPPPVGYVNAAETLRQAREQVSGLEALRARVKEKHGL